MNNIESLTTHFPQALTTHRYLAHLREAIEPLGFNRSNTFTCTSVCRDELCQSLTAGVGEFWQHPYIVGGMAGLPPGGIETWQVGMTHIPDSIGRGKILVVAAAHIGIAPDGSLGTVLRYGQSSVTPICGALGAAAKALSTKEGISSTDVHSEIGWLVHSLNEVGAAELSSDILALTLKCAEVIDSHIWASLNSLSARTANDIVVATGVQIHTHDDTDHILPIATNHMDADGVVTTLDVS
ncbi:MAG: hypothetical protein V9F03_08525 [Microthrixaceae bacterium]